MNEIYVCAGCLASEARLYNMSTSGLQIPYQLLVGIQYNSMEMQIIPGMLCWECAALVHKFNKFRTKCTTAFLLLKDVYMRCSKITVEEVNNIVDGTRQSLQSPYAITKTNLISFPPDDGLDDHDNKESVQPKEEDFYVDSGSVNVKLEECDDEQGSLFCDDKPEASPALSGSNLELTIEFDDDNEVPLQQLKKLKSRYIGEPKKEKKRKKSKKHSQIFECNITEQTLSHEQALEVMVARQNSPRYLTAKMRCDLCYQGFKDRSCFQKHQARHDPKMGAFECKYCKMRFRTSRILAKHNNRKHTRKYTCNVCGKLSFSRETANSHFDLHKKKLKNGKLSSKREEKISKKRPVKSLKPEKIKEKKTKRKTKRQFEETMMVTPLTQEEQLYHFLSTRNEPAPFKCDICQKGHIDANAFSNHMRKHDPVSGKYICDLCKYRFKSRHSLGRHIAQLHINEYSCKICKEKFYNSHAAIKHHFKHKGKVYTCEICGFVSKHVTTHMSHVRLRHAVGHVCGACGVPCVSEPGLKQHLRLAHQITDVSSMAATGPYCGVCSVQFVSQQAWTRHMLVSPRHTLERDTIKNGCPSCGETFSTSQQLRLHRRVHKKMIKSEKRVANKLKDKSQPMSHICEQCGKGFYHYCNLKAHLRKHMGVKNHTCTLCNKSFVNSTLLRFHMASHSQQRPYQCDVCRKSFKLKSALTRHMYTHTGEKPYTCHICSKTFSCTSSGRLHIRNVHRTEPPPTVKVYSDRLSTLPLESVNEKSMEAAFRT